jgi:hypothetical protein
MWTESPHYKWRASMRETRMQQNVRERADSNTKLWTKLGVVSAIAVPLLVWGLSFLPSYLIEQTSMEIRFLGTTTLVEKQGPLNDFHISVGDREIRKVTQLRYLIMNTGREPIRQQQIVTPPTICFDSTADLLDATIESRVPNDLQIDIVSVAGGSDVQLRFPLLNSGDQATLSVLIADQDIVRYSVTGRIAGIKSIHLTEDVATASPMDDERKEKLGAGVLVSAVLLLMATLTWLYYDARASVHRRLVEFTLMRLEDAPESEIHALLDHLAWWIRGKQMEKLRAELSGGALGDLPMHRQVRVRQLLLEPPRHLTEYRRFSIVLFLLSLTVFIISVFSHGSLSALL